MSHSSAGNSGAPRGSRAGVLNFEPADPVQALLRPVGRAYVFSKQTGSVPQTRVLFLPEPRPNQRLLQAQIDTTYS